MVIAASSGTSGLAFGRISAHTTNAPSFAYSRAIARPRPEELPVITVDDFCVSIAKDSTALMQTKRR